MIITFRKKLDNEKMATYRGFRSPYLVVFLLHIIGKRKAKVAQKIEPKTCCY
jgi:hypothetical protein